MQPIPIEYQHNIEEEPTEHQYNIEGEEPIEHQNNSIKNNNQEKEQQQMSSTQPLPPLEEADKNRLLILLKLRTPKSAEAAPHNDITQSILWYFIFYMPTTFLR